MTKGEIGHYETVLIICGNSQTRALKGIRES